MKSKAASLISEVEFERRHFFGLLGQIVHQLMNFASKVGLLGNRMHILAEVFLEYLDEKGDIGAIEVKGSECHLQSLDVAALLGVVLEVVFFGGKREAADR